MIVRTMALVSVILAGSVGFSSDALALIFTWTGDAPDNGWTSNTGFPSNTTNWQAGANTTSFPGSSDSIILNSSIVPGSINVDLQGSRSVQSTTLQGTSSISITGSNLVVTGSLNANASTFGYSINSNLTKNGGTISVSQSGIAPGLTINGDLSSTGFSKTGSGTLRLTNDNPFLTGGVTVSSGTLRLGNQNALSKSTMTISAGGIVDITTENIDANFGGLSGSGNLNIGSQTISVGANNAPTSYSGDISGAGGLTKQGGGSLTLTGDHTYNGATSVSSGTLILSGATLASSIQNSASVAFEGSGDTTVSGGLFGTGNYTKTGSGTLILTGNGSIANDFSLSSGVLQIGNGGSTGSLNGEIVISGSGTLDFNRSGSLQHNSNITGAGNVVITGPGTVTLSGANTYSGGTTLAGAILSISSDSHLGSLSGDVIGEGGILRVTSSHTSSRTFVSNSSLNVDVSAGIYTIAGDLTGSGAWAKLGSGTLQLIGSQTETGNLSITAGTLLVGNGGTTGAISGNVGNNGTLAFQRSDDVVFNGAISGTGGVTHSGTGTLELLGANTYSGPTEVNSGTLQVSDDSNLGSGGPLRINDAVLKVAIGHTASRSFELSGDATIDVDSGEGYTIGNVQGSGKLLKQGDGFLALDGINTYSGGTEVLAGELRPESSGSLGVAPLLVVGAAVAFDGSATFGVAGETGPTEVTILGGTLSTPADEDLTVGFTGELTLDGGSLATRRLQPMFGSTVRAQGNIDAKVLGALGSTITSIGNLDVGNNAAVDGFFTAGELNIESGTTTLLDANDAVLESSALVTLGDGLGTAANLSAPNGLTLDYGGNITGYGTIEVTDSLATRLLYNGNITGNSMVEPITLLGYVKGNGSLDNVVCELGCTMAPGLSPVTAVYGSVAYNGTLEIEIGGTSVSDYDQLNHLIGDGVADLGGTLDVQLLSGFTPSSGDTFTIITATDVQGSFAVENLPAIGGGLQFDLLYGATDVTLAVVGVQGDYNLDGTVNLADYTLWRNSLGAAGEGLAADGDLSGTVDAADYIVWKDNFGATALSAAAIIHQVPEPSTACTLLVVAMVLGAWRARQTILL